MDDREGMYILQASEHLIQERLDVLRGQVLRGHDQLV